ncbi:MAG: YIP1 family protein [Paracoccaceae bacterium]
MQLILSLFKAAYETLLAPRQMAHNVKDIQMPRQQRWQALILVAALSAVLSYLSYYAINLTSENTIDLPSKSGPFGLFFLQITTMFTLVFAIQLVGSWAGGTGTLDETILLVAWMQFVLVSLQILQVIFIFISPVIAFLIGLAGVVLVLVLLTVFISALHGFKSLPGVFLSMLVVLVVFASILGAVLKALGIDIEGVL